VFAGGDIVTGAATVILAMGAGKKSARAMDRWLAGRESAV
jgi:glutamate synthase (NADPH/NADH) small chain